MAEDVAFVGELEDFDDDEPLLSLVGIHKIQNPHFASMISIISQGIICIYTDHKLFNKVLLAISKLISSIADADVSLIGTSVASGDSIRSSGSTGSGGRLVTLATADSLSARQTLSPENNLLFATSAEDLIMSELVLPMPQPEVREQPLCGSGGVAAGGSRDGGRDSESASARNADQLESGKQQLKNSSGNLTLQSADAECQTLSTGDILATKLFHEPFANN